MSIFKRGNSWYCDFATPGGKRIKKSLGTSDRKQAQELHDKLKAEQWRIEQVGDFPDYTYEEACLRWLEEKADKKSIEDDKNFITFWLEYFEGVRLKDITENAIYKIISKMTNKHAENCWRRKADTAKRKERRCRCLQRSLSLRPQKRDTFLSLRRYSERRKENGSG